MFTRGWYALSGMERGGDKPVAFQHSKGTDVPGGCSQATGSCLASRAFPVRKKKEFYKDFVPRPAPWFLLCVAFFLSFLTRWLRWSLLAVSDGLIVTFVSLFRAEAT